MGGTREGQGGNWAQEVAIREEHISNYLKISNINLYDVSTLIINFVCSLLCKDSLQMKTFFH